MKPERLTNERLAQLGEELPGWEIKGGSQLSCAFAFPSYLDGIEFVRQVAMVAESIDHHPDLEVGWRKVMVWLSTHTVGGLTELDVELARRVDAIFKHQF